MTTSQLLASLGVRGAGALAARPDAARIADSGFAELLAKAREGEISSGLPVTLAPGAEVELTESQLARVAKAADRAEAQGATRALLLIDGVALTLDVGVRQVTGSVDMNTGMVTGIDAVLSAPPEATPASQGFSAAALLRALGGKAAGTH